MKLKQMMFMKTFMKIRGCLILVTIQKIQNLLILSIKKIIGKMTDEVEIKTISEFVWIKVKDVLFSYCK